MENHASLKNVMLETKNSQVLTVEIESEKNWQKQWKKNTLKKSAESMSLLTKEELEVRLEQIQQEKIDVIRKKQRATEKLSRRGLTREYRATLLDHIKLLITMEEKLHEFENQCNIMLYHLNHHCKC